MPFSLRLDPATEARIRRLAAAQGRSRSDVVREAVAEYGTAREALPIQAESALDLLKPFVGIARTGGANLSTDTHAKYRALVQRKQRARRPR
jgi:predicted DNA-binding protein